ncbi:MAG: hypothetical protein IPO08_09170 [Xanthomonadales bacterium]|nr:hypothetical protein [Xanthomonadales bacterium]
MKDSMSLRQLHSQILEGRGVGLGDAYQSWIRVTKRNTSSKSNQSIAHMPGFARQFHFLSRGEKHFAHLLLWLGVMDVREQFPLWPWPHPHPMLEHSERPRPQHPGVSVIAKDAGIALRPYRGLAVPAILSIDQFVTLPPQNDEPQIVGISCKPLSQLIDTSPSDRIRERLELDRRYCDVAELKHLLVHPEQIPKTLHRQLDWLAPLVARDKLNAICTSNRYRAFIDRLNARAYTTPLKVAASEASKGLNLPDHVIRFCTHTALWRLDLDVDLLRPISMFEPIQPGGRAARDTIRKNIFGEMSW